MKLSLFDKICFVVFLLIIHLLLFIYYFFQGFYWPNIFQIV